LKIQKKQIEETVFETPRKIEVENLEIFENGLIKGHNFESHEHALNRFIEILPKIRRNV
jgi:uncharacterized protein